MSKVKHQKTNERSSNRWLALIFLALAQFLVVLDSSIINIALPSIGEDLLLGTDTLSWVITAFIVPFGGLLLLGGRLADRFGHRTIFMLGVIGFILGSALASLSNSIEFLLAARIIQGISAAFLAPSALALVTLLFTEPSERAKALGLWGIVAGLGSGAGVLLGGILTSMFGWTAIFFINIPVGVLVVIALPMLVTKDTKAQNKKTDVLGAVTVTAGLVSLVTSLTAANQVHIMTTVTLFVLGIVLLVSFIFIEKKAKEPLVPFSIFLNPSVAKGNLSMLFIGGAMIGLFFGLSVYMQMVLEYDALTTGLTQLPLVAALVLGAGIVPEFMNRVGTERTLVFTLFLFAAGLVWLSFAPSDASFVSHLLGPTIVLGAGAGGGLVSSTALAVSGVAKREEGLAGGLMNSSQQIGGAFGITILVIVSAMRTDALTSAGFDMADALTGGFSWVFLGAAIFAIISALLVIFVQRKKVNTTVKQGNLNQSR